MILELERQRRRHFMTQSELAARLYITQAAVSAWETEKATPSPEKLRRLGRLYGVDPLTLLRKVRVRVNGSAI